MYQYYLCLLEQSREMFFVHQLKAHGIQMQRMTQLSYMTPNIFLSHILYNIKCLLDLYDLEQWPVYYQGANCLLSWPAL